MSKATTDAGPLTVLSSEGLGPTPTLVERLRTRPTGDPYLHMMAHEAADEIERLRAVLTRIGEMDAATDSIEGPNEWGEADCFHQAQSAALLALGPNV